MRILFLVTGNGSRSNFVTGYTMRYGHAGLSGTDTSTILIAEYLAKNGYEVIFAYEKPSDDLIKKHNDNGYSFTPGTNINGVTYTFLDLENIENRTFDILISSLWFEHYNELPVKITKGIFYWCHLAWIYFAHNIKDYALNNNLKLGYVNISKWAEGHHQENIKFFKDHLPEVKTTVIPNPMTVDVMEEIDELQIKRKKHKVIFPAQWSRGGFVAERAAKAIGWEKDFTHFDYVNLPIGVDKTTLFKELAESDYFFFPQYGHNKWVLKDVHSCAVGEALGMGVIVLSYPLGSHEEYYSSYYEKLDFPPGIDMEKMMTERATEEPKMDYIDSIIKSVNYLERNPDIKEDYRKRSVQYIRDRFHIEKIGPMWVDFLNKF